MQTSAVPAPAPSPAPPAELQRIPLAQLFESPWNPRKHFDPDTLAEMVDSLRRGGQLTPIIVRPTQLTGGRAGAPYEIGAGHRRFRAAPVAGLTSLLAVVRPMDDVAFLELLTIENKQRDDVTPLDEAAGFKLLMAKAGYDVSKLAARIGLSVKYVYDRLKLLQLIPEAKQYLEDGTITAGHAILLARLAPAEQKRVIGNPRLINRYGHRDGTGLFQHEYAEYDPEQPSLELKHPIKARSVRELAMYINDHVRFRPEDNDLPNLFPAAAAALKEAEGDDLDPVYITYDHYLRKDAKDRKARTYSIVSWRRADGRKSKTCPWSRIGIVAAGRNRGDAFRVCVNRDKCATHFPEAARARARRAKAPGKSTGTTSDVSGIRAFARRRAQDAREEAERARWTKALPQLRTALAAKIRTAPTGANTVLGRAVLAECRLDYDQGWAKNVIPLGRTADDVVRRAGWIALTGDLNAWRARSMIAVFKKLGLDAEQIVDQVAPKPVAKKPAKAPAKKKVAK